MKRESFKSRLGFLLVSAGCAIELETYGDSLMWLDKTVAESLYYFT